MPEITSQLSTALADRYRIERHLGEGGMAIVYLAHDLRHDRRVALKVLRPELAAVIGAERFLTEIRVTANLQHPHILPLHDSGDAGSFLYYVMPFIDGDSLRDKLNRERQLAIEDAVEITRSISSALDYAHRQNVIHRDIKPENVLMHDGQPLVADFGIALAVREASGQRLTETGLSLGTPHYMSPEQAMGDRELDARSDIYSLGAMLYEMLAGEPPYHGTTAQAIVAKVITEKAPMVTAARDTVPPHINAAIAKALNKMPADRFGTAAAFADALANPAFSIPTTSAVGMPAPPPERRDRRRAVFAAAAAGVTLALGFMGGRASAPEPAARLTRFVVPAPEGVREYDRCCAPSVALSPDGQWLVFVGVGGGGGRSPLYRRHISQIDAEEIPGTDDAGSPFFSPDSRWVGFGADGRLRKVPIAGGPPVTIVEASRANSQQPVDGASWGDNDVIVLSDGNTLYTVPAGGGGQLTVVPNTEGRSYIFPTMLPGGTAVIARANGYVQLPDEGRLVAIDLETGATDTVGFGTFGAYAMGHLLFSGADGTLLAQPFNPGRRRAPGSAVALFDGLKLSGPGVGEFAVSRQGGLAFEPGTGIGNERLVLSRPDGAVTIPLPQGAELENPAFSPEGERIALQLVDVGETPDIWIYDLDQRTMFRLTVEGTQNHLPVWTHDGSRVAFASHRGEGAPDALYWKAADGSGTAQLLLRADDDVYPGSWFPDDRTLAIMRQRNDNMDIGFLTIGDSTPRWILESPFTERQPQVSPDGRWLAYTSDRSGRAEVYVQAIDGPGRLSQVSTNGGSAPRWGPNGNVLFYADPETSRIVAATVATRDGFRVTDRTPTQADLTDTDWFGPNYDIHPDGEGVLVISEGDFGEGPPNLVWVLDWPEMMREVEASR